MTKQNRRIILSSTLVMITILSSFFIIYKTNLFFDKSIYYSEYVTINKDTTLYIKENDTYLDGGTIYKGTHIKLDEEYDKKDKYFKIKDLEGKYYIKYNDITKSNNYYTKDSRYQKYIVFNENIITDDEVTFYYDNNKLYTLNTSFNLPIIIKDDNFYYAEYNDMLLAIAREDVREVIPSSNTDLVNTKGVPVLNYHFVYDPSAEECNEVICHTKTQFTQHLKYIKDNGYFTPTSSELEKYMSGKLNLPNSVMITIDDGRNINFATKLLEEYQLNATAFIVTSRYDMEEDFIKSDYVEWQSHSHALHDAGTCPSGYGQGGGLTCLDDEQILEDLSLSSKALHGSIAFCYPFYEYTNHAIELLKEAGFMLAFGGEYEGGKTKAEVGGDKFRIPRWVIVNYTSMEDFISYVSGRA